eukprot:CAMPEP_0197452286 /NCGR_PEP_ID=MMETSP1175-20131217/31680_1 /TAXON_ID=1003142 /ORGANISM="Triceratium dubium, Strain CCMP147" /LENGTH=245 /DNA_ID=CAMNT_0042985255 /DNA_START=33 /DNA_END=770 /DNA_ORIENTATION=-
MRSFALALLAVVALAPSGTDAFFGGGGATSATAKVSPEAMDAALELYSKKFTAEKLGTKKRFFFSAWGMPKRDIDGTATGKIGQGGTVAGKSLFDVDEGRKRSTFSEIVRLYGEDNALEMVKALPNILAFDSTQFSPALDAFGEIFGEEEANAMVVRNPGLLAVKPKDAATSTDQTMQFSYLVAYTRPIGNAGLPAILSLLSVPGIEQVTNIPIRAQLFAALSGTSTTEAAASIQALATGMPMMN